MALDAYGWNEHFAAAFAEHAGEGHEPGRVLLRYNEYFTLATAHGELLAELSGRLLHRTRKSERPAVGDWVVMTPYLDERKAVIHATLPRTSKFSRRFKGTETREQVVAANIDTLFIVTSLNQELSPRRLERYLTTAVRSGARPVILLNKADLVSDPAPMLDLVRRVAPETPIHMVSAARGTGLDVLAPYLETGQTVALVGSSGVGKSSLINTLLGEARQAVREIRESDKGRHTTTHRELIRLPEGALLVDTPGMMELQLWEDEEPTAEAFTEIEAAAERCRFRDCRHEAEPGCAVREAMERGEIPRARYDSYHRLHGELRELSRKKEEKTWKQRKGHPGRTGR